MPSFIPSFWKDKNKSRKKDGPARPAKEEADVYDAKFLNIPTAIDGVQEPLTPPRTPDPSDNIEDLDTYSMTPISNPVFSNLAPLSSPAAVNEGGTGTNVSRVMLQLEQVAEASYPGIMDKNKFGNSYVKKKTVSFAEQLEYFVDDDSNEVMEEGDEERVENDTPISDTPPPRTTTITSANPNQEWSDEENTNDVQSPLATPIFQQNPPRLLSPPPRTQSCSPPQDPDDVNSKSKSTTTTTTVTTTMIATASTISTTSTIYNNAAVKTVFPKPEESPIPTTIPNEPSAQTTIIAPPRNPFQANESATIILSGYLYKKNTHGQFQKRLVRCDGVTFMCFSDKYHRVSPFKTVLQTDTKKLLKSITDKVTKTNKLAIGKYYLTELASAQLRLNPLLATPEEKESEDRGIPNLAAKSICIPKWVIPISKIKSIIRVDSTLTMIIRTSRDEYVFRAPSKIWLDRWMELLFRVGKAGNPIDASINEAEKVKAVRSSYYLHEDVGNQYTAPDTATPNDPAFNVPPPPSLKPPTPLVIEQTEKEKSTLDRLKSKENSEDVLEAAILRRQRVDCWKQAIANFAQRDVSIRKHLISIRVAGNGNVLSNLIAPNATHVTTVSTLFEPIPTTSATATTTYANNSKSPPLESMRLGEPALIRTESNSSLQSERSSLKSGGSGSHGSAKSLKEFAYVLSTPGESIVSEQLGGAPLHRSPPMERTNVSSDSEVEQRIHDMGLETTDRQLSEYLHDINEEICVAVDAMYRLLDALEEGAPTKLYSFYQYVIISVPWFLSKIHAVTDSFLQELLVLDDGLEEDSQTATTKTNPSSMEIYKRRRKIKQQISNLESSLDRFLEASRRFTAEIEFAKRKVHCHGALPMNDATVDKIAQSDIAETLMPRFRKLVPLLREKTKDVSRACYYGV